MECKTAIVGTVPSYTSCSGLPTANTMCFLSTQKKDGNVYKRRKMDKDSNSVAAYEEAFHLSCCNPGITELPSDDWFCKTCSLEKPKGVYGKLLEGKVEPSGNTNQRSHGMSHIQYMLKDTEQYVSGARIGRDFQADVPEFSGPTSRTDGYFHQPSEFDPAELIQFNSGETSNQNRTLIGNWMQCCETVNFGDSDKVCGKWRRVPLYVVQSDDWNCSCCLPWDPARADCAVPQELKTSEVLKQLKYINMLKNLVAGQNQKPA